MDVAVNEKGRTLFARCGRKGAWPLLALPLAVALAGCDVSLGNLSARAPTNGRTPTADRRRRGPDRQHQRPDRRQRVEGTTLEVRAERIAKGATDAAARTAAAHRHQGRRQTGPRLARNRADERLMIGAGFEVRYHVRAPQNAVVNVTNTNGQVVVNAISGKVIAHTTNGAVKGTNLTGGVDGETTNGSVSIDMASLGSERVSLETTNGSVTLMLPEKAKATQVGLGHQRRHHHRLARQLRGDREVTPPPRGQDERRRHRGGAAHDQRRHPRASARHGQHPHRHGYQG